MSPVTGWAKLELDGSDLIKTIKPVVSGASSIVNTMSTLLTITKRILDVIAKLYIEIPDLETAALKAAIATIRALMEDLTKSAGCFYLPVPIQISNAALPNEPLFAPQPDGWASIPMLMLPPIGKGTGGNYGFMKAVSESLNDQYDILRPQLNDDAHVAGVVVLAGATTYLRILPLIDRLVKLFSGSKNAPAGEGLANKEFPAPKTLQANLVAAAVTGVDTIVNRATGKNRGHPAGVRLSWPRTDKQTVLSFFPEPATIKIKIKVTKVVVFRSTYPILPNTPYEYLSLAGEDVVDMYKEYEYDGWNNQFYDDTIELGKTYFYTVGYRTECTQEGWPTVTHDPFFMPITHIYIPPEINAMPRSGVPPDWLMLPSPLGLIPGVGDFVAKVNMFLDDLEKRLDTGVSKFKLFIDALKKEIERYHNLSQEFLAIIQGFIDLLKAPPDIYLGVYAFAGKGGNAFFLNTLGKALTDPNDPDRPPFDIGDEIVTGFVLMAGSAAYGELTAFIKLLELIFMSGATQAAAYQKEIGASIDLAIETVEREIKLLDDLSTRDDGTGPELASITNVATSTPTPAIGPDLEPAVEQNDGKECKT